MVFDDTCPKIKHGQDEYDWTPFYGDVKEAIPLNAPTARGNSVSMTCFVDADHAGNRVTRRSHTGILLYVNRAPISWYSKQQMTVVKSQLSLQTC